MYRLLIADDEKIERMVLGKTLRKKLEGQCQVFEAENGREALEIYKKEKIQIAIFDIEMPGINGIEAARRIRENDPFCCIIFLTAFDEFNYARSAVAVHALEYLLKPYDETELFAVVDEAMRLTEQNRRYQEVLQETDGAAAWNSGMTSNRDEAESRFDYPEKGAENGFQHRIAETIRQYVQENYQEDISMQDAASAMNYSDAYFCKLFKQCFGKSFTTYLMEYRVNEAKKLLYQPLVNVREVSRAVGYVDSNYFAKVFKRVTGLSPSEYRKKISISRG